MTLYDEDLAHIQAAAFGGHAEASMPAVVALLRAADRLPRRVIDVGCGAGVSTEVLVREGFDVIAIEPSAPLARRARARAPAARFVEASAFEVELPTCDAVIALGEVLGYHAHDVDADARLSRFFDAVASSLPAGGLFLFDLVVSEGSSLEARSFRSAPEFAILVDTTEDRARRRLTRDIETFVASGEGLYRRSREVHEVRTFDEATLVAQLSSSGLDARVASSWGAAALLPRRRAFVATKR